MKSRSVTLAIAVLALWLVPSDSLAQGNSGKTRLTICHIPAGNPDARRTMTVPEPAWGAHESHGDTLGPCDGYSERYDDGYGADTKRSKKAKTKKGKKEYRGGSDRGDADDEIEADDRADERESRAGGRSQRGAKSDGQTDDPDEEKRGFFRGMRQFFGFGGDESEE